MKTYKTTISEIRLTKVKTDFPNVKITSSKDSNEFIRNFYHEDIGIYESFFLLMLNRQNNTIGYAKISQGGVTGTFVDVAIIAKYIVENLATGCILAHNHPSGNLNPSEQDKTMTKQVQNALKLFNCQVLDHMILTEDSYFSFSDEGIL
jgi:DNA repair protein RadC